MSDEKRRFQGKKDLKEYSRIMDKPSLYENADPEELSKLLEDMIDEPELYKHEDINEVVKAMKKRNMQVKELEPVLDRARQQYIDMFKPLKARYDIDPNDLTIESLNKLRRGMEAGYIPTENLTKIYDDINLRSRQDLPDFFEQIMEGINPDQEYKDEFNEFLHGMKNKHIQADSKINFPDSKKDLKGMLEQGRQTKEAKDRMSEAAKGMTRRAFMDDSYGDEKRVTDEMLERFRKESSELSEDPIMRLSKTSLGRPSTSSVGSKAAKNIGSKALKGLAGLAGFLVDSEALGAEEGTPEYNLETYGTEEEPDFIKERKAEKQNKMNRMQEFLNKHNEQYLK